MMLAPPQPDCFLNIIQEFLVCTTIHKAKHLSALNVDTYVRVTLEKKSKCTKVFHNSENPYYNEYFVFELSCTLAELLRLTVLYEVKKKTCCKVHVTLGELLIDLHTVWNQPYKSFCKKWGKLENSIGRPGEVQGHLQIDLSIVSPNQPAAPAILSSPNADDIESNLLQSLDSSPCNIRYTVCFFRGTFVKKSDYMLQVSLAGMNGKTSVRKNSASPEWNEEIQFNWTYPSLAQTFLIQVMSHDHLHWKSVAESEIYFDEISFNALPSLGPTYIHFYDFNTYIGRVLMEIKSDKLDEKQESTNRMVTLKKIQPFVEKPLWVDETYVIEFLTWQGEFIHANASNMKLTMRLADHTSDPVECFLNNYSGTVSPVKYFKQAAPFKAIHIKCFLPDNRLKYESDHFMYTLVEQMKSEMESFKLFQLKYPQNESMHCKCLKAIILSILGNIQEPQYNSRLQYNGFKQLTVWDENRLVYLKDFFGRLTKSLRDLRQNLKTMRDGESDCHKVYQELEQLRAQMESIMNTRIQDELPELHLIMTLGGKGGGKPVGICKLNAMHFLYSQRSECTGRWCSVPRNFVFKDISCTHSCKNCGCVRGFVYGWLRVATETEQTEFQTSVEWEQKERFYYQPKVESSSFICRLYVHQAKVQPGSDRTGLCDAKLKVLSGEEMIETSTVFTSLSPVWNESMAFAVRQMPGAVTWYERNPPLLAVQMYDTDKLKTDDYLGCGLVKLVVQNNAQRKQPLQPMALSSADVPPEGSEDYSFHAGRFRSRSTITSLKKFVKTRVALQQLKELKHMSPPPLKWVPMANMGTARVEVLMSGELLQVQDGESPDGPKVVLVKRIPKDIQPIMGRYLLEVVFIGLRSCQKLSSSSIGRYRIHVRMGEVLLKSGVSGTRLKNSINFIENYASGIVNLPEQFEYWPPIIATQVDYPGRKREVTLGATLIPSPSKYLKKQMTICDFPENTDSTVLEVEEDEECAPLLPGRSILKKSLFTRFKEWLARLFPGKKRKLSRAAKHVCVEEAEYNWWTKFYNSMYLQEDERRGDQCIKHRLVIYGAELEKEADFNYLTDWAEPFPLVHGVKFKKNKPPKEEVYATLKMHLKLAPCHCFNGGSSVTLNSGVSKMSSKFQQISSNSEQTKVVVRVYLVQGLQFRSQDTHSQSDSYVKLYLGSHTISDRAHHIPNQSNPIFGKRFQMDAVIPREHILQIAVYDRGGLHDEFIGTTFIDLEDRLRTKHRATVGIASEFTRSGYNIWRDSMTPYEILKDICKKNNLSPPYFDKNSVEVDGVAFEDTTVIATDEDLQERLSLSALKNIQDVPSIGRRLVPEHVETRSLYRSDRPGVEQGKLQLWVEIYEAGNLPPPIDITPTPSRMYELRIVIYNCSDVKFQERNVFGTKMSDIYIKGWCSDPDATQSTDVHYRSLTGEGNFNWRMIFPIKYSTTEDMMVIKRKGGLLEQYETKQPPMVYLQIWENDTFSSDDFMGCLEINLSNFPEPFDKKTACTDSQVKKKRKSVNLFREKVVKGWFPCRGHSEKGIGAGIAGKLELELEILSETEAGAKPAGLGRNPPNAIPAPDRPEASFNPLTNPIKALKLIILPLLRNFMFYCLLGVVLIAALLLYLQALPDALRNVF